MIKVFQCWSSRVATSSRGRNWKIDFLTHKVRDNAKRSEKRNWSSHQHKQRFKFEKTETPGEEYIRQQSSQHNQRSRSTAQSIGINFNKKVKVANKIFGKLTTSTFPTSTHWTASRTWVYKFKKNYTTQWSFMDQTLLHQEWVKSQQNDSKPQKSYHMIHMMSHNHRNHTVICNHRNHHTMVCNPAMDWRCQWPVEISWGMIHPVEKSQPNATNVTILCILTCWNILGVIQGSRRSHPPKFTPLNICAIHL